jgi:DNA-binding SARP family transcriptional activator
VPPGPEELADLCPIAPFRESGSRVLTRALGAQGDPAKALLVHDRLQRLLREELGVVPGEQTGRLHRSIVRPVIGDGRGACG